MAWQMLGLKRGHAQFGNRIQLVLQLLLQCYQIWRFKGSDDKSDPNLMDVAGFEW